MPCTAIVLAMSQTILQKHNLYLVARGWWDGNFSYDIGFFFHGLPDPPPPAIYGMFSSRAHVILRIIDQKYYLIVIFEFRKLDLDVDHYP